MSSTFDWNEWFLIFAFLFIIGIIILLPRRINILAAFINWVFVIFFIEAIDYFLALSPYDLYDFLDGPIYKPTLAVAHVVLYPGCAYVFTYFYDKWKLKGFKLIIYIAVTTVISVSYEWLCVLNNVLNYKDWNILYSIPTYPVACMITIRVFNFIKSNF